MGLLVDGRWHDRWYDTSDSGGHFVRNRQRLDVNRLFGIDTDSP